MPQIMGQSIRDWWGLGPRLIGLGFGSVRLFPRDRLAADDSALCWIEG